MFAFVQFEHGSHLSHRTFLLRQVTQLRGLSFAPEFERPTVWSGAMSAVPSGLDTVMSNCANCAASFATTENESVGYLALLNALTNMSPVRSRLVRLPGIEVIFASSTRDVRDPSTSLSTGFNNPSVTHDTTVVSIRRRKGQSALVQRGVIVLIKFATKPNTNTEPG